MHCTHVVKLVLIVVMAPFVSIDGYDMLVYCWRWFLVNYLCELTNLVLTCVVLFQVIRWNQGVMHDLLV